MSSSAKKSIVRSNSTKPMTPPAPNAFEDQDVAVNLKLLKRCHFYQMFDPSNRKVFGWNVHRLSYIVYAVVVQCFIFYGNSGSFAGKYDDVVTDTQYWLIFYTEIHAYYHSLWKMIIFVYNADRFSDLFDVTRIDFLTSQSCRKHNTMLYDYRKRMVRFTNWYMVLSISVLLQWFVYPLALNLYSMSGSTAAATVRYENVMNLRYDVSIETYNRYIAIFMLMELTTLTFVMYFMFMADMILMTFCSVIITQQAVLMRAFKNVGREIKTQTEYYQEFKSILHDQRQINLKINLFFSAMKPLVLAAVAFNSMYVVLMTYLFVLVYLTTESGLNFNLIKLGTSGVYTTSQLFIYTYLFDSMNTQRELINFSIYSCDWTNMNLKFKKLLLLTMQMNNANQWLMKASPKKIVNLQSFSSIISMSYNVVSVMLKTTTSKKTG